MKFAFPLLRPACLVLGLAGLTTSAATVEERLQLLEDRLATVEKENASLKKQLGYDAKGNPTAAIVSAQGKETRLSLGGFVQAHAEFGRAPDSRFPAADRFLLRRARLGVKGSFAENFDFVLLSDWSNNSLNSTSGFRAQLVDAFIVWNKYPLLNLTAGQFKVPYGYDQLLADTKTLTVERPLPNDQLTLPRQAGLMAAGAFPGQRFGYALAFVNGNGTNISFNDNDQFTSVGRVSGTALAGPPAKLTVGLNGFRGVDTGTFTGRRTGAGADAQLTFGRALVNAEVLQTRYDRATGTDTTARGWSVLGGYFLVPNKWQGILRYESYDPNTAVGGDRTTIRTIGLTYLIKGDDLKLQVNYLSGNSPNNAGHRDRLLGRLQVVF